MLILTDEEKAIANAIQQLSNQAGSHSPSIFAIAEELPQLEIKIDACFLSNPYATDLVLDDFTKQLIHTNKIKKVLEYYPSQNQVIANVLSPCLNVPAKNIFIGNGATEIIQAVIHNFTTRKIIVNIPTFSPYYEFVKKGVKVVLNELNKDEHFEINIENYIQLVEKEKPDTIVLINPNNPSAGYITLADIKFLLNQLRRVDNIIIDESFIHFAYEDEEYEIKSAITMTEEFRNLIIVKSMTKDFGIAGIRAGYAVMDEEKIRHLLRYGYLWNVSGLAEYFFRLYAQDEFQSEYEKARIRYIQEAKHFFSELSAIEGLKVYPSMANFVLVELTNGATSYDFVSKLLIKYGIYFRDGSDKIGLDGEFARIASRTKDENEIILDAIKEVLQIVPEQLVMKKYLYGKQFYA